MSFMHVGEHSINLGNLHVGEHLAGNHAVHSVVVVILHLIQFHFIVDIGEYLAIGV